MPLRLLAFPVVIILSCVALLAQRNAPPHPDLQGRGTAGR
jgi:hypothetical protein